MSAPARFGASGPAFAARHVREKETCFFAADFRATDDYLISAQFERPDIMQSCIFPER
jgi:hypothetical protein